MLNLVTEILSRQLLSSQTGLAFYRLAVTAFCRRRHENRRGHITVRELSRTVSALLPLRLRPDRFQHFIGRDGDLIDAAPYCVVNRVVNRRRNRQLRALSGFFSPERAIGISVAN